MSYIFYIHKFSIFLSLRHRRVDEDSMTLGAKCCFTILMLITQILLHGVVGLVLYWVWMFHKGDDPSKIINLKLDLNNNFFYNG